MWVRVDLANTRALLTPKIFRGDGTISGALWCHGADSTYAQGLDPLYSAPLRAVSRTRPVLTTNMGGTATWGNDTARTAVGDALTLIQGTYGAKTGKVVVMGMSHGAAAALNYARQNPSNVFGVALFAPVVDLVDIHDNNRGGYATAIETAYGGSSGWNSAKAAHNPAGNTGDLAGIPIKAWYSTDDPICTSTTVTTFITAVSGTSQSLGAVGHALTGLDPKQVSDFVDSIVS